MTVNASVDATNSLRSLGGFSIGVNLAGWDTYLSSDPATGSGVTPNAQTLSMITQAGISLLRLSNGSGADEWHFASGTPSLAGVGLLGNVVAAVGAQALVTVNYGTGSPEEAAAYLAYLNGTADNAFSIGVDANGKDWGKVSDWAALRGQTPLGGDPLDPLRAGHTDPFGFKRFEVGNEVYFRGWAGAPASVDPADYVTFAVAFAGKAQSIDASASIGLGLGNPVEYDDLWNAPVLQACRAQNFIPGFICDHFYVYDGNVETLSDQDLLKNTVSSPGSTMPIHASSPRNWADRARAFRSLLSAQLGAQGDPVELICGEFNSDADAANKQSTSLVKGLFIADAIGLVLATEYNAVVYWDLRNAYARKPDNPAFYGWRTGGDDGMIGSDSGPMPETGPFVPYPAYFGVQLATKLIQNGDQVVTSSSSSPDLSLYAAIAINGHLILLAVNKNPGNDLNATIIELIGFVPSGALTWWRYGMVEDAAQRATANGAASVTKGGSTVEVTPTPDGGNQIAFGFPSYSMTVLDLEPQG